jgi:mannosyltransferase
VSLLGLGVRAVALNLTPLWSDEAFMAVLMRRSLPAIIDVVHNDNHPPLQYLLVRVATLLGDSPFWLRFPSVLAGTAAVPIAAALGRRLGGNRAGLMSGAVVALTPLLVLWSRDARMYALATTMVLAMALALWRAVEKPTAGRLTVYGLTVLVGVYSHYFVALAVPPQLLAAALCLRPSRTVILKAAAVAAISGATLLPWLLYASPQFRHAGEPYWAQPLSLAATWSQASFLVAHPGPTTLLVAIVVLGVPAVLAVALRTYRAAPVTARQGMLYLAACGVGGIVVLALVSLRKPVIDERFLNLYTTELLPPAGAALAGTGRRWLMAMAVVLLLATTVLEEATLQTPEVPVVAAALAGRVDPARDVVALEGPTLYFQVLYYGDEATQRVVRVVDRAVPWYVGLAAFRPGDIVPAVPDAAGSVYLVRTADQPGLSMPAGLTMARRHCARGVCLETWTH